MTMALSFSNRDIDVSELTGTHDPGDQLSTGAARSQGVLQAADLSRLTIADADEGIAEHHAGSLSRAVRLDIDDQQTGLLLEAQRCAQPIRQSHRLSGNTEVATLGP